MFGVGLNNLSFVGNNLCIDVADKNHTGRDCDRRQSTVAEQSGMEMALVFFCGLARMPRSG